MLRMLAVVMLVMSSAVMAEDPSISWKAPASATAPPGGTVMLRISVVVPPGWHTYTAKTYPSKGPSPTTFVASPASLSRVGKAEVDAFVDEDVGFGFPTQMVSGATTFSVPIMIDSEAKSGSYDLSVAVTYSMCDDKTCLRPAQALLVVKLEVAGAKIPQESGLLSYFLMAMGAGFLSLLTPCVFPMIPITVSFFIKRAQVTRARTILDAFVFSLGIIGASTVVGLLFSVAFNAASLNQVVASPWFNLAFAGIVLFFAGSLFGVFELAIPSAILNGLSRSSLKMDGLAALLLMGLLFALTSFTCTGPFIGQTLVTASQGEWMWPLFGMLGYSIAFASPFFLLAMCPSLMKLLPKSGGWLNSVKVVMGFMETAFAMKFISAAALVWGWSFLSRDLFLCSWMSISVVCSFYLLGWFQLSNDTPLERVGGLRMLIAVAAIAVACWLGTGLIGRDMGVLESYLPPSAPAQRPESLPWSSDLAAASAESARTGVPIILEFSGFSCSNCNMMERRILPLPEVQSALRGFLRVRLYTDGEQDAAQSAKSAEARRIQAERFKTVALPLYVIIAPDGHEVSRLQGMTYDAAEFLSFLSLYNVQQPCPCQKTGDTK